MPIKAHISSFAARVAVALPTAMLLLVTLTSCDLINTLRGRDKVAKVGKEVLYRSDLRKMIPAGTTPEDSARMAERYIDSWALSNILLNEAEKQLSKPEKDVTKEVEDFRKMLLGYRYETSYVESRLDTLVTAEERLKYYNDNSLAFVCTTPIVKARVIRISPESSNYSLIKRNYATSDPMEAENLKSLCDSYADGYTDFDDNYVGLDALAKFIGVSVEDVAVEMKGGDSFEIVGTAANYLVYIYEKYDRGEISPFEYNAAKINVAILTKRKQDLLLNLERDLLDEALNSGKFKLYNDND